MSEPPRNLWEAVGTTEPGAHAHVIGQVLYDYQSRPLPEAERKQLYAIRDYLEKLAHAELAKKLPAWHRKLLSMED